MADEQTNQTPQDAATQTPGETVDATATPSPVPPVTSIIRNVRQTAQEREIIKTAPDIVVYLDGLPYLINSYLNDPVTGAQFQVVNFNDHVQNFNASYGLDNLIPTGSVNLSVPNHQKRLYQSPGGNNIITTMMEVQVFAKGYFLSKRGNTIYHRVFKGLTSNVTHTDNGKTLEISIQIRGVLRFLEMMQIDVQPSLDSNSPRPATPYQSNQWNLDPYMQIADTFLRGMTFEGFQLNTIANKGQTVAGSEFARAVEADYVVKWQTILNGVRADAHVMGYIFGSVEGALINAVTQNSSAVGNLDPEEVAAARALASNLKESDSQRDAFVNMIRGYMPDFKVSNIQLVNGRIVPRLERIRTILHTIGFEGYQDINGEVIFKAPLYNLDVTNLSAAPSNDKDLGSSPFDEISEQNNPFVVFLSEIEGEIEAEDESAIRATRLSVQGIYSTLVDVSGVLRQAASHIDIPKLARFGLREEPARTVPWIAESDKLLLYTYAVNELVRSNRGYRTYQFTMPMRPELRLGFPMYIPHKDMYGYIKAVTINYAIGGEATTSVVLDTIRKRPMFPTTRKTKAVDAAGHEQEETILTTQPNLVMKWTKSFEQTSQEMGFTAGGAPSASPGIVGAVPSARPTGTGDTPSNDPSVNEVGNSATQRRPQDEPVYQEQLNMENYRKTQVGTDWSTRSDTKTHNFRVQNDNKVVAGKPAPFFSRDNWLNPKTSSGINATYYNTILTMQPYTDEKGYEVVGVFPLGRWKSLPEAYKETREGKIVDYVNPQAQIILKQQDALVFAGLGTPSHEPSSVLLDAFKKLTATVSTDSSFELDYTTSNNPPAFGPQPAESNILSLQQPDNQPLAISDLALETLSVDEIQRKVNLFISGTPQPLAATKQQLKITGENQSNTDFSTVIEDFKSLGK